MCGNTDKNFKQKSQIRLLDPSSVPNSTPRHTRLDQKKSTSAPKPNKSQDAKGRGKRAGSL